MLNISEYETAQKQLSLNIKMLCKACTFFIHDPEKYDYKYLLNIWFPLSLICILMRGNISDVIVARTTCPRNTSRFLMRSRCTP